MRKTAFIHHLLLKPASSILKAVSATVFPATLIFYQNKKKHNITVTSFTATLSEFAGFPLVRCLKLTWRVLKIRRRSVSNFGKCYGEGEGGDKK